MVRMVLATMLLVTTKTLMWSMMKRIYSPYSVMLFEIPELLLLGFLDGGGDRSKSGASCAMPRVLPANMMQT